VVAIDGPPSLKGQIIDVQITDARGMTLFGRVAEPAMSR
jgi:hypothetical protein